MFSSDKESQSEEIFEENSYTEHLLLSKNQTQGIETSKSLTNDGRRLKDNNPTLQTAQDNSESTKNVNPGVQEPPSPNESSQFAPSENSRGSRTRRGGNSVPSNISRKMLALILKYLKSNKEATSRFRKFLAQQKIKSQAYGPVAYVCFLMYMRKREIINQEQFTTIKGSLRASLSEKGNSTNDSKTKEKVQCYQIHLLKMFDYEDKIDEFERDLERNSWFLDQIIEKKKKHTRVCIQKIKEIWGNLPEPDRLNSAISLEESECLSTI